MKFLHSISTTDTKIIKLAILAISVGVLFLNVVLYTYYNAIPLVKSDGWRYIQLFLVPWYEGSFKWELLWADHHQQPLVALFFIANSELFGLKMDYEALAFVIVSMAVFLQLAKSMKKSFADHEDSGYYFLSLILVALFIFSLTSRVIYVWSLVTLGYVFLFFAVRVAETANSSIKKSPSFLNWMFLFLACSLFLIVFGNQALVFVMATLIVVFMRAIIKKDINSMYALGVIALAVLAQTIFYQIVIIDDKYRLSGAWLEIVNNASYYKEYLFYIGVSLLSVWVNISAVMTESIASQSLIFALGMGVLTLYIVSLLVYARSDLSDETILPAIFILTAIIMAVGSAAFRFDPQTQAVLDVIMPRYYLNFVLAPIGVIWIWCHVAIKSNFVRTRVVLIRALFLIVLSSQMYSTTKGWEASKYIRRGIVEQHQVMLGNSNGVLTKAPSKSYIGGNPPERYLKGLVFLKKHQLNIFAENNFNLKYSDSDSPPKKADR